MTAIADMTGGRYFRARDTDRVRGDLQHLGRSSSPQSPTSAASGRSPSSSIGRSAPPSCWPSARHSRRFAATRWQWSRAASLAATRAGSSMAEFHFLRPLWLALLPVGAWLIWQLLRGRADSGGWRNVVDAELAAVRARRARSAARQPPGADRGARRVARRRRRARGPGVGAVAGARVSFRRGARRRSRFVALDGRRRRGALAARAREAEAARLARAPRGRADGARRILDARVHRDAADHRYAHDLLTRQRSRHEHHADAGRQHRRRVSSARRRCSRRPGSAAATSC